MADPRQTLAQVAKEWSAFWFLMNLNGARIKLTGGVLNVDTGNLRDSLGLVSRLEFDGNGFLIGTNVDYGVYWEGTPEGRVAAGEAGFGGSGTAAARSFIRSTLQENGPEMELDLERRYNAGLRQAFPNFVIDMDIRFSR
jgi:hypothetical protein